MDSSPKTSYWRVKNGKPDSIPECQENSGLVTLGEDETSCGSRCFYFRCTNCIPLLALDHYNPAYETKVECVPRIDYIKPLTGGLFKNEPGYHGEILDFYGAYLSQIEGLNGIAIHSWSSEHAKRFFNGVQTDFEIDWLALLGSTLNVFEIGRRNLPVQESSNPSKKVSKFDIQTSSGKSKTISKGTKMLIKEKINKLVRDKSVLGNLLFATGIQQMSVNYFLVLPNIPIEDIKIAMEEQKDKLELDKVFNSSSKLAIISSDAIPLQNAYIYNGEGKVSEEPEMFKNLVASGDQKLHPTYKYLISAVVISMLLTKVTTKLLMEAAPSRQLALSELCSKEERKKLQLHLGWTRNPVYHFPKSLVLGPEQFKALNSKRRVVLLMGEAGSGKTTVLLVLIFKYTGKHLSQNDLRKIIFFIPAHKTTFRNDVENFIRDFCFQDWVQIVAETEEFDFTPKSSDAIFLFDEIYDTDFITHNLDRGKIYSVLIRGEKLSFKSNIFLIPRPDVQIIYFRRIYRTPANISKCCAKLKRLLDMGKFLERSLKTVSALEENSDLQANYKEIPWEMSFSHRIPLRESNTLEVKVWDDEKFSESLSEITETDFVVTWQLECNQVKIIEKSCKKNQMFHERKKESNLDKDERELKYTKRYIQNDIVLICGKQFEVASLSLQQWLFADFDPLQNQFYVICYETTAKDIVDKFFDWFNNTESGVTLHYNENVVLLDRCSELSANIAQNVISVITFDCCMEEIGQVMNVFDRLQVERLINCSVRAKNVFEQKPMRNSLLAERLEEFNDIILVYGDGFDSTHDKDIEFILKSIRRDLLGAPRRIPSEMLFREISTEGTEDGLGGTFHSTRKVNISVFSEKTSMWKYNLKFPGFNKFLDGSRLFITLGASREISNSLKLKYNDEKTFHLCIREKTSLHTSLKWYEIYGNYSHIILLFGKIKPHFTMSELQSHIPRIDACTKISCVCDEESFNNLPSTQFNFNGRRAYEMFCYSRVSDHDVIISKIPSVHWKPTLLLGWALSEDLILKIKNTFPSYTVERITGSQIDQEPNNAVTDYLILVLGENNQSGACSLTSAITDLLANIQISKRVSVICHILDSMFIESVILSTDKLSLVENYLSQETFAARTNILYSIPYNNSEKHRNVLIITWKVSKLVADYIAQNINRSCMACTVCHIGENLIPLSSFYDEVVFICSEPFSTKQIASALKYFSQSFGNPCTFYFVGQKDHLHEVSSLFGDTREIFFPKTFCFVGSSLIEQIRRVPVLRHIHGPNVLLMTLNLDKSLASEIDRKFEEYTTKHVDLIPWSSDSLAFTGSEFDRVVLVWGKKTEPGSPDSLNVLYTALSRAKRSALILCHRNDVSRMENLLNLSAVDQAFEKLRWSDNMGKKLPSLLNKNPYDILEAFTRIIVTKNVAQFYSLEKFISKCSDSKYDWIFDHFHSMLLTGFSWGPEIADMLNSFLNWRQSTKLSRNIFQWHHYLFMDSYKKEEIAKILESIDPDFRATTLNFDEMKEIDLKMLGFSFVCWNQMDALRKVLKKLNPEISSNDNFYKELLYYTIALDDIDTMKIVIDASYIFDFQILTPIPDFISGEMLMELILKFLLKAYESQTILKRQLGAKLNFTYFQRLLHLLPTKIKFSSFRLQDKKQRNVLMLAVTNSEIFELILERAEAQGDLDKLLSQKDSEGWSCLRHACQVENLEVVKLLIENHSFNWLYDVDVHGEYLYNFVRRVKLFPMMAYLDYVRPWTIKNAPNLEPEEIEGENSGAFISNNDDAITVHAIDSRPVEEEVPKEIITVKSDKDLLLRTTIDKSGKYIEFKAADNYNGFTGKIGLTFHPFSVLGEEKVSLEIVPESLVHAYNETSKKLNSGVPEIITPILHIDRESDTSFLRDVEISFPVFPKFFKNLFKCQSSGKLLVESGKILLRESKFSPAAVCHDEFEGILRALRIDTHFSLAFRKLGVYLLVEQFPENEFLFDLRPFRDEEEHRLYRMDEKKTFRMIINPQLTDSSIYGSRVSIIVQEPAVLRNSQHFRNVRGNEITFIFPHLEYDVDCTNERRVTVVTRDESFKFFRVEFHFKSSLLEEKGIDGNIKIPLYSEEELTKFSTKRFVQSKGMLLEFLKRLDSNWATFLADYLGVEMRNMKEFIGRDIRLSLPPSNLNWSEEIKRRLKMETDAREFQEVSCREQLVETMLKNYQSSNDMFKAKVEIFEILKSTEGLASDKEYSQGPQPESREILASALMYIPVTQLRKAMRDCYDQRKLFSPTPDVEKFIDDGELPEGEGPGEMEAD